MSLNLLKNQLPHRFLHYSPPRFYVPAPRLRRLLQSSSMITVLSFQLKAQTGSTQAVVGSHPASHGEARPTAIQRTVGRRPPSVRANTIVCYHLHLSLRPFVGLPLISPALMMSCSMLAEGRLSQRAP